MLLHAISHQFNHLRCQAQQTFWPPAQARNLAWATLMLTITGVSCGTPSQTEHPLPRGWELLSIPEPMPLENETAAAASVAAHDGVDLNHYQLFLSSTTLADGERPPEHVRYRPNVPLADITTYFQFRLCKVQQGSAAIITSSCVFPFYDEYGPLIVNLHTLKTIKDPLEKLGVVLHAALELTFDTYGFITEKPGATAALAGLGAGSVIATHQTLRGAQRFTYSKLLAFTQSLEFKALGLKPVSPQQNPGLILRAILKTGMWKKDPLLAQAALNTGASMAAKLSTKTIMNFSLGAIITALAALVSYQMLPPDHRHELLTVAGHILNQGHTIGGELISQQIRHQLQHSGSANPRLMKLAILWHDQHLFTPGEGAPVAPKMHLNPQVLIPALGSFLHAQTRPYVLPIKKYCLPTSSEPHQPRLTQTTKFSFGNFVIAPTSTPLTCINL